MLVHAPGEVKQQESTSSSVNIDITAWPVDEYRILITRIDKAPAKVIWNDAPVTARFLEEARSMIITLRGCGTLELREF
jgi:hypothetical protein